MAETVVRRGSVGKKILYTLVFLLVLLVIVYFVATSAAFFKGVILPRAGKSMDADITVADASISPFSSVVLKDLKVKPHGQEQLLQADEVLARYSLMHIIRGDIDVQEATVSSAKVTVVENADGTSNLDFLTKKKSDDKAKKDNKPPQLNVRNVSLKNATVQKIKKNKNGHNDVLELANVNVSLDQLKNGQPGKLDLSSDVRMEGVSTNGQPSAAQGKVNGKFEFTLTDNLLPKNAKGNAQLGITQGTGTYKDLANLNAAVTCDLSPEEIKEFAIRFSQGETSLGELKVSGPFNADRKEGKLHIEIASIDKHVLALAAPGMNFGSAKINAQTDVDISKGGALLTLNGQANVNSFSITQSNLTTPQLDLNVAYNVAVDQNAKVATVNKFTLNGTQNKEQLLSGGLSKPMKLNWGSTSGAVDESDLEIKVTNFRLSDWKAFLGPQAPMGTLGATLSVASKQSGKDLQLKLDSNIADFSGAFGSNKIERAEVVFNMRGRVQELDKVTIETMEAKILQQGLPVATLGASGTYGVKAGEADLKATAQASLAKTLAILALPDVSASSGEFKFSGNIKQKGDAQSVVGNLAVDNFTGKAGTSQFDRFTSEMTVDVDKKGDAIDIRKLGGTLKSKGEAGGKFDISGSLNSKTSKGNVAVNLNGLNEHAFAPFAASIFPGKQLISASLNGSLTATLNSTNDTSIKGEFKLANVVVKDPAKKEADAPLAADLKIDAAMSRQVLDLKVFQVALSPTARAKNQLNVTGQIDMSKTNAIKGKVVASSESFDVTPWYDLTAGKAEATNSAVVTPGTTTASTSTTTNANVEPAPMNLPVESFTLEAKIGKFYLREIEAENFQATVQVNHGKVMVNPMKLTMNGAPVSAMVDLDLGVKGYRYTVDLSADKIPLEPVANTFVPEDKGKYQGNIIASAHIQGAGVTGASLRTNLTGQASFAFTNANIQIAGKRLKPFLSTVALVLQAPELLSSPLSWTAANLKFGEGKITVDSFNLQSDAFVADTHGTIPIADVLTNSPLQNLPVNFGLNRSLAAKAHLVSQSTATNSAYAMLPGFLSAGGTLGQPKAVVDKTKLLGTVLEKLGGKIPGVNEKTGNLLQGLGGFLSGGTKTNSTPAPAPGPAPGEPPRVTNSSGTAVTQKVSTNSNTAAPVVNELLNLFKKKK